ncbi:hypothetical protein FN846DRAFT_913956 [Sphaerosporella brunnea]|uniref:Uncharacterized protein n=1 Tax=Sphaerosporella brunnea TaxID=1250544 RepID=A0A5J5EFJ7_9PEZI|nr:hypothetical protein FN846DRAFT_913956 [Sphaerosporella brunnea]
MATSTSSPTTISSLMNPPTRNTEPKEEFTEFGHLGFRGIRVRCRAEFAKYAGHGATVWNVSIGRLLLCQQICRYEKGIGLSTRDDGQYGCPPIYMLDQH